MSREQVATIDYECRSACDLRKCGSWRYSQDATTEILCLAFRLPRWAPGRTGLWVPDFPHLDIHDAYDADEVLELLQWIRAGKPVEGHNSQFERGIWKHIQVPRYGWPAIDPWQFRCSAAKAAAHTLPRALEDASVVLKLSQQKDMEGSKLMKKLMRPRKPRKAERAAWLKQHGTAPMPLLYHESKAMFERLWAYCRQDVIVEEALSAAVPDLLPSELELYLIDQEINSRGFQLDQEAVSTALSLIATETPKLNKELCLLTGGAVAKATQRAKMLAWFSTQGLDLPNTQKDVIADALTMPKLSMPVRRGLELLTMLGKSSTSKYTAMSNWMGTDGRVRGGLLFHGAGTGRWSGAGVQPQNFVRGQIKDMSTLWTAIKTKNRSHIQQTASELSKGKVKDVLAALSNGLRGAIVAPAGRQLYVGDFAAIEARVVLWMAEDDAALDIFQRGEDIYREMASTIYNVPLASVDKDQRQLGKQAILAGGFGLGWAKFITICAGYGIHIEDEMAQQTIRAYRKRFWRVVNMWKEQEEAAMRVVRTGQPCAAGRVLWFRSKDYLYVELPSGRRLAYPYPRIQDTRTAWGEVRPALTFMGVNQYTRKWTRQSTYGGSLVENLVQSCARCALADAIKRCEMSGVYDVVLHAHDEIVAEADLGTGSVEHFNTLISMVPKWADGLPIAAESWSGLAYRK